jgi:serine/threonine protein kinase
MSDSLGDPLRSKATPTPSPPSSILHDDEDAALLLDGSVEPTDDSPTVISKTAQPQNGSRSDDLLNSSIRGRRLAHFELIEPIGVGGMAAVLRARDTQLDRLVALKILPPEMAVDPENVRRFHQEARSAARLDHENIARVFFCGEDQRLHFIAFEFVEGENLRTILERRGRLPVGEALHYMLQVAAGLAHAARRGVVHRDIKPSNIIITPNGRAKLVDMGLARSLEPQHDMGLTQSGVTLGTFDYISPEQALEPRDADVRSDIYSLGCTFYHMLTGQPPVPEGTAAKKLHHHQHVKPTDPRQFVPDLPDEAAIILDRMMAKQPKDRYQTPEHLVHHLYLAARKLGAAAEVPEGVLTVEAALPAPPTRRPLVLGAVAVLAVVALIFLVDTSSPTSDPSPPFDVAASKPATGNGTDTPTSPGEPTPPKTNPEKSTLTPVESRNTAEFNDPKPTFKKLAQFLRENESAYKIVLSLDDLVRSRDDETSELVIANPELEIRPLTAGKRPAVHDQYLAQLSQTFQSTFIVRSKKCTIDNIRFILDQNGCNVPMAMLRFEGTPDIRLTGCEFVQLTPRGEASRMASVLVEAGKTELSVLMVRKSCFLGFDSVESSEGDGRYKLAFDKPGGQDAIARRGRVQINAQDCAFGPHAAVVHLEGAAEGRDGLVSLSHCSVIADHASAVFDVAKDADAAIEANFSLFSRLNHPAGMEMMEPDRFVLVHCGSTQGKVSYRGFDNRYHRLDQLLTVSGAADETLSAMFDGMRENDKKSRDLESSPWKQANPLESLQALDAKAAFEVDPSLRELRGPDAKRELIGAERVLGFSYVDRKLPDLKDEPNVAPRRTLIVQERKKPDYEKRLYPTLSHALLDARPGDVIRLQWNGELKLDPHQLSGEMLSDLTLRADAGFHPVLTLNAEEQGNVPALFEIYNGKLQLEGLEVRLKARVSDDWCAVVSFFGEGACTLKNCVVTLEQSNQKTMLALVPRRRMKKMNSAPPKPPQLTLENCFVRGYGDLLMIQGGACTRANVDKSLVALHGSLVVIESDEAEERAAVSEQTEIHLQNTTTYLEENLLRLHSTKSMKGLAKTHCLASACLFLPAGDRSTLVRLEGPESEQSGLRDKFIWESGEKNAYGKFPALLEIQSSLDNMKMPASLNQEKWKREMVGEMSNEYNVILPNPPATGVSFAQMNPPSFRPPEESKACGVDPRSLPSPLETAGRGSAKPEEASEQEEVP